MGSNKNPWGKTPIKDQTQAEFEAHHRENQARAEREAREAGRKNGRR